MRTAASLLALAAVFIAPGCGGPGAPSPAPSLTGPAAETGFPDPIPPAAAARRSPETGPGAASDIRHVMNMVHGRSTPAPVVHAKVLAVNNEVNIVMLSVGSDDGVKKGHVLTVYRGKKYIGQALVEKVFKDMCSARILASSRAGDAKEGDDADTRRY